MKIRILKQLRDGVFNVRVQTEEWSEREKELMVKLGEPEINLGGTIFPICGEIAKSAAGISDDAVTLEYAYVRVMTESPFTMKFDSRDYSDIQTARCIADTWASNIADQVVTKVNELRDSDNFFTSEEVVEI